jgi:small-conductance mechanosensitive channel
MAEVVHDVVHGVEDFVSREHINELKEELLAAIHQQESNYDWLWAILLFALIVGVITGAKKFVVEWLIKQAKKSDTKIDDAIIDLIAQWTQPYVVIAFAAFVATETYPLAHSINLAAKLAFLGILTFRVLRSIEYTVHFVSGEYIFDQSKAGDNLEANFHKAFRGFLYAAGVIFVLDNLGLNVSSIVAGLGIGGLAIALAAQAVLGDAIASVSLFVDQPFKVGDAVTVNGHSGVIDQIGFKTTKLRSNGGEIIVFPNSVISGATLQNFTRALGGSINQDTVVKVNAGTATDVVQNIPSLLFEALAKHNEFTPTEIYLIGFGDYSINFEVRYSVHNASPPTCRAALGKINQIVLATFRDHSILPPLPRTHVQLEK